MISPRGAFGGGNGNIIKSNREQLRDAEQKIARLQAELKEREKEAKVGVETIEQLKWMCARQRVAISALGVHYSLTPESMKDIVQPYFDKEVEETAKEIDGVKKKFVEDVKAGKVPEFTVTDNPDKKE